MSTNSKKLFMALVIALLLVSVSSLTGCFAKEEKTIEKKEDNGGNENNTTNGNGNNDTSVFQFELHHEPLSPELGETVHFTINITCKNPYDRSKVYIIICDKVTGICLPAEKMTEEPIGSGTFIFEWQASEEVGVDSGEVYQYHLVATDSLQTTEESETIDFLIS